MSKYTRDDPDGAADGPEVDIDVAMVEGLLAERAAARERGDFTAADAIRVRPVRHHPA